jgi:hypothetical protein
MLFYQFSGGGNTFWEHTYISVFGGTMILLSNVDFLFCS